MQKVVGFLMKGETKCSAMVMLWSANDPPPPPISSILAPPANHNAM
jgi:hypothetical protein